MEHCTKRWTPTFIIIITHDTVQVIPGMDCMQYFFVNNDFSLNLNLFKKLRKKIVIDDDF